MILNWYLKSKFNILTCELTYLNVKVKSFITWTPELQEDAEQGNEDDRRQNSLEIKKFKNVNVTTILKIYNYFLNFMS